MLYYMSDLHFGHKNILDLCNRPFSNVEDMNRYMVNKINEICKKEDTLYILGDVASSTGYIVPLLRQINCQLVLIVGNHDLHQLEYSSFRKCFKDICYYKTVSDGDYRIFLSHYPLAEWDGFYRGNYLFYGHVHNATTGGAAIMQMFPQAVNVGVDVQNFLPHTAEELISKRLDEYRYPDMSSLLERAVFPAADNRYVRKADFMAIKNREDARMLWDTLSDIPIDENECIECPWNGFSEGTFREEIWKWFEDTFHINVSDLMYD